MTTLAQRLRAARRRQFVGRLDERALFREALGTADSSLALLYIYGPGGVGKTSLLRQFAHDLEQQGQSLVQLDGRNLDATPDAFVGALQHRLQVDSAAEISPTLAGLSPRPALFVDTVELLSPLEGWLRDEFLPQLPQHVLVVLAGRRPPSLPWRTDPGWQSVMRILPLANLSLPESRALLMRRQVPAQAHEPVLRFTHGHPLALSLVADVFAQRPDIDFRPEAVPDVIKALLEQFMQQLPSAAHRSALEACSQVQVLNETLLAAMLQLEDAHPLFDWLRQLSFIDAQQRGIFPHDLAREALAADLRWRAPAWQAELHTRARDHYMTLFRSGDPRTQRRVLSEYIFLHRENPVISAYFEWQTTGTVFTDRLRPPDAPDIVAMVRQHEGAVAAEIAAYWLERQPEGVAVLRRTGGQPHGVLIQVALEQVSAADRKQDPGTAAASRYLEQHHSLRAGERATLFRFWMSRDSYQRVSPVQSRIFLNMVQHYLTTPGLVLTLLPCAAADFWREVFTFADLQRLPDADFAVDGRTFGVYGHDWRAVPPLAWLALLAERELATAVPPADQPAPATPPLEESQFKEAVRSAFRDYTDLLQLQENPLLHSRLLQQRTGAQLPVLQRVNALQELLLETTDMLQTNPRQRKFFRALYHTYVQPAATQEAAAELLNLPFSTYRRHLRTGLQQVADLMWTRETGR